MNATVISRSVAGVGVNCNAARFPESVLPQKVADTQTLTTEFSGIAHMLSSKPLRRPATRPAVNNSMLRRIAAKNPPKPEYYERDEEKPF